ncbi:MAG TPA: hypothetical protein DEF27_06895 [Oscillatoriales bacterium UBA8482]|nr:MAG: hypothetical protein AUK43_06860 [Oscillatoriales cyanobacterium CG2_30_40_61]HBW57535.1 hypothetical protein [Oscillatoriales bacterium UBA8482]
MNKVWRPYASYRIWLEFEPPIGQEQFHCDMKRGFSRAKKREPGIEPLLKQDTTPQRIGLLAQQGIYEFHQNPQLLSSVDGVDQIAEILKLNQESNLVHERVKTILNNYYQNPILVGKEIIQLNRGDEGFPPPILIKHGNYSFNFFAAIDCIFEEADGTLHILDFKTGRSNNDLRQAYLYLLADSYLYPDKPAIASFYNLEKCEQSKPISASKETLKAFEIEMAIVAQRLQKELKQYRFNRSNFESIFPPNPGVNCHHCPFNSICKFSSCSEVAA